LPPLSDATVSSYPARQRWPYRLDPRAKLLGVFFYTLAILVANRPGLLLAMLAAGAGLWLGARLPVRALGAGVRPLFWLALVVFTFQFFFGPGPPDARLGPLSFSSTGAWLGLVAALRLLAVGGAAAFLLVTTEPLELMEATGSLLQPLKRFSLPAEDVSLVLALSLRFIPLLTAEAERISWAQRARGLEWQKGPPWQRLAKRGTFLFPLLVGLFRRAEAVATAMEARAYRRGVARTRLYTRRWRTLEAVFLVLAAALLTYGLSSRWWPELALF